MYKLEKMLQKNRFRVKRDGEIIGDVMLIDGNLLYSLTDKDSVWEFAGSVLDACGAESLILDGIEIDREKWERKTDFYMVRHATTRLNEEYRLQGWFNPPLSERGEKEAEKTGQALKDINFIKAVSSDLERAWKTMEIALDGRDIPMERKKSLREIKFGKVDTLTVPEVMPDEYFNPVGYAFCGGEDYDEVSFRIMNELRRQSAETPPGNIFVACSSAAMYQTLHRIDPDRFPQGRVPWKEIPNAAYLKISYEKGKFEIE